MYICLSVCKASTVVLSDFNETSILKYQIFMKIRPVGAEVFHRTDRHYELVVTTPVSRSVLYCCRQDCPTARAAAPAARRPSDVRRCLSSSTFSSQPTDFSVLRNIPTVPPKLHCKVVQGSLPAGKVAGAWSWPLSLVSRLKVSRAMPVLPLYIFVPHTETALPLPLPLKLPSDCISAP